MISDDRFISILWSGAMKFKGVCRLFTFVVFLIIFTNLMCVDAMNTGFSTEELTEKKQNEFASAISISLLTEKPAKKSILCFDVNENGMIAVCQDGDYMNDGQDRKEVCIYSSDGKYLYGYTFCCSESIALEWDNDCINICFIRSSIILSIDSNGNILDVKEVQNTVENNAYENKLTVSTSRIIGNTKYLIKNDMGIFNWIAISYSQIVTIDASGNEKVIYDVNSTQFIKMIIIIIAVFLLVLFAVVAIVRQFINAKRQ